MDIVNILIMSNSDEKTSKWKDGLVSLIEYKCNSGKTFVVKTCSENINSDDEHVQIMDIESKDDIEEVIGIVRRIVDNCESSISKLEILNDDDDIVLKHYTVDDKGDSHDYKTWTIYNCGSYKEQIQEQIELLK